MDSKSPIAPPPSDAPYMEAVRLFLRVMRRHHACVEGRIGDLGIHHSQHRLLMLLARCNQIPSQKELAEMLGVSPAAVATTLKRLEKEGYIARTVTDEDNRRHEIRITEAGLRKVEESREIFGAVDRLMFDGFSEAEIASLLAMMKRMDENFDAAGAPVSDRPLRRA